MEEETALCNALIAACEPDPEPAPGRAAAASQVPQGSPPCAGAASQAEACDWRSVDVPPDFVQASQAPVYDSMDDALDDWKLRGYCFIRQSESLPDLRSVITRFFDMEQSAKLGFHEKADRYPTGYQDRIDEYDKELFIARRTGTLWPSEDFRDVALRSLEHLEAIAWEASGVRGGPGTSLTCIRYLNMYPILDRVYDT